MSWAAEQPQQPWQEAFRGIVFDDGTDLADLLLGEEPVVVVNFTPDDLEKIAERIQTLNAIVAQNALVSTPETEDENEATN